LLKTIFILLLLIPFAAAHYGNHNGEAAELVFENSAVEKAPTIMQLHFINWTTGRPYELQLTHERLIHVFAIGEDLDSFAHIHPEEYPGGMDAKEMGIYKFRHAFPYAGRNIVVVDYMVNGIPTMQKFEVQVSGEHPATKNLSDLSREKTVGDYTIKLETEKNIQVGKETQLDFYIEENHKPVTDLQMYLGSEVHVFIVHENLTEMDHTHTYIPGHGIHVANMTQRYTGPRIPVRHAFTSEGIHAIFAQFKHNDKVITTKFLVDVKKEEPKAYPQIAFFTLSLAVLAVIIIFAFLYNIRR
jgi:hypothetical protein